MSNLKHQIVTQDANSISIVFSVLMTQEWVIEEIEQLVSCVPGSLRLVDFHSDADADYTATSAVFLNPTPHNRLERLGNELVESGYIAGIPTGMTEMQAVVWARKPLSGVGRSISKFAKSLAEWNAMWDEFLQHTPCP